MRWRLRLSPFDFETVHRPGRKNQVPDAVSRLTRPAEPEFPVDDDEIRAFEDALLSVTVISAAQQTTPPGHPDRLPKVLAASDDQHKSDGIHPNNVEDDDELDAIDLYQAAEEHLEDELGNPDDAEELTTDTETPAPT